MRLFSFLGGVPRLIVPDNLKSGINKPSSYDPEINRSYGMMANHYGIGVLPARRRSLVTRRRGRTASALPRATFWAKLARGHVKRSLMG